MAENKPAGSAAAGGPAGNRATRYITSHYFMTNLGLFGLLSTLAVTLTANKFSAPATGFLILVFTIANKAAKIPLAPWLDKLPITSSVLMGCLTAAAGFVILQIVSGLPLTALALILAGLGISVNALASKQLAADASDRTKNRARLFSLTNIAVNVASAVAAPAALFFVNRHHYGYVLTGVAAIYCTAGVVTSLNYQKIHPERRAGAAATSLRAYRTVLALPGMRSFMVINFLGWLCYGQLFNSLAVYTSSTLKDPGILGWLYTLNALLIVVAQLSVSRLVDRYTKGRRVITAAVAYMTFALAFVTLYLVPGYLGAVMAVTVFTLAEMMFVPTMDVVLLGVLGGESRSIAYGLFSLGDALGESVGGGVGVAVYRWLVSSGYGQGFWLITAALALTSAVITNKLRATSVGLRSLPTTVNA